MSTRQWSIKGNQISGDPRAMQIVRAECDGPVPEVNETVHVIEKSAYDAIKAENERLRAAVVKHLDQYCPKSHDQSACTWMYSYDGLKAALDKGEKWV